MTRHEEDDAFTIEMTLRNFPPQEPFVVRREHPLMVIDGQLDPAKLKKPLGREPEHTAGDILKLYNVNMKTTADWQRACEEEGVSRRTFFRLKKQLEAQGKVANRRWTASLIVRK